jgi:hypothetical protein
VAGKDTFVSSVDAGLTTSVVRDGLQNMACICKTLAEREGVKGRYGPAPVSRTSRGTHGPQGALHERHRLHGLVSGTEGQGHVGNYKSSLLLER